MNRTFYRLKFHTNCLEVSKKALEHFGELEAHEAIQRHFQGEWGYLDEADLLRNEDSLQNKSGTIQSRFESPLNVETLLVESCLDGNWTMVSVLGEDS